MKGEFNHNPESESTREVALVPNIEIDKTTGHILSDTIQKQLMEGDVIALELADKLEKAGQQLDDESKRWLSLLLDHPDWADEIYQQLETHKKVTADQAGKYLKVLQAVRAAQPELEQDMLATLEDSHEHGVEQLRDAVDTIHQQLGVQPGEAPEKITLLLPSEGKESGWGITVASNVVISSHPDNPDNIKHEYMHSFVNGWVASLVLSEKKEQFILDNSPSQLREEYGDDVRSLLTELTIRTYLYGPPRGEQSSVLADRLADLMEQFQQQPDKKQSFGNYLKQHFADVIDI